MLSWFEHGFNNLGVWFDFPKGNDQGFFFELLDAYKCLPFNIMIRINFMLIWVEHDFNKLGAWFVFPKEMIFSSQNDNDQIHIS